MNGYEVVIWTAVYHNNSFSHHTDRREIVHAEHMKDAPKLVELKPETKTFVHEKLTITTSGEYIYRIHYLGRVAIRRTIVYVKD